MISNRERIIAMIELRDIDGRNPRIYQSKLNATKIETYHNDNEYDDELIYCYDIELENPEIAKNRRMEWRGYLRIDAGTDNIFSGCIKVISLDTFSVRSVGAPDNIMPEKLLKM